MPKSDLTYHADPSVKDKLVTLSTCALQGSRRFVVQGYLVETITLD